MSSTTSRHIAAALTAGALLAGLGVQAAHAAPPREGVSVTSISARVGSKVVTSVATGDGAGVVQQVMHQRGGKTLSNQASTRGTTVTTLPNAVRHGDYIVVGVRDGHGHVTRAAKRVVNGPQAR